MTKISKNVYWQMEGEGLFQTVSVDDLRPEPNAQMSFLHTLNLFDSNKKMDLGKVQLATLESMKASRALVSSTHPNIEIDFVSVNTPEDAGLVPDFFLEQIELERDVTSVGDFSSNFRLPLVFDILDLADSSSSSAETLIFTNSDICLTPSFYSVVGKLLELGFDSIIVNRRTVHGFDQGEYGAMAVADYGESHPGLDCFVFPRSWINDFAGNTACVGSGQVMRGLLMNLVAKAQSLLVLTEAHLTYHFGDDRPWLAKDRETLEFHNIRQAEITYRELIKKPDVAQRLHTFFDIFPKYRP